MSDLERYSCHLPGSIQSSSVLDRRWHFICGDSEDRGGLEVALQPVCPSWSLGKTLQSNLCIVLRENGDLCFYVYKCLCHVTGPYTVGPAPGSFYYKVSPHYPPLERQFERLSPSW